MSDRRMHVVGAVRTPSVPLSLPVPLPDAESRDDDLADDRSPAHGRGGSRTPDATPRSIADTIRAPSWLRLREAMLAAGRWCAVASLFCVPLNKPATNVALGLAFLFSMLGTDTRRRWTEAARHPVARGALVWWTVLMLSALHAWYLTASFPHTASFVWACVYPLLFASLLQTTPWRRRALLAFASAAGFVVLASFGMSLGLIPQRPDALLSPAMHNTVFKEYTQQGLATLILAAMAAATAIAARSKKLRRFCLVVAGLALLNVTLVLASRTTYLTLVPLAAYWIWRSATQWRIDKRVLLATLLSAVAILALAWSTPFFQQRLVQAIPQEVELYLAERQPTSAGIRLELWRRTLPIIAAAPLFGHGLHQWAPLYRESIARLPDFDAFDMGHPHQEMLLIAAEQGLAGLAVYLLLLLALARYVQRLEQPERDIYNCLLLIYLAAGLANGLWADFTHRHVFILLLACIPLARRIQATGDTPRPD